MPEESLLPAEKIPRLDVDSITLPASQLSNNI